MRPKEVDKKLAEKKRVNVTQKGRKSDEIVG